MLTFKNMAIIMSALIALFIVGSVLLSLSIIMIYVDTIGIPAYIFSALLSALIVFAIYKSNEKSFPVNEILQHIVLQLLALCFVYIPLEYALVFSATYTFCFGIDIYERIFLPAMKKDASIENQEIINN